MLDRLVTSRLRPLLTAIGLASLLALGACGGGSGAPNNPYDDPPPTPKLRVDPESALLYSGIPSALTVVSGVAPFYAFTQNTGVLPITQNVSGNTIVLLANVVVADTQIQVTVRDSAGQEQIIPTLVKFSPLLNSVSFAPSGGDCGANLCSGQRGTVTAVATGPTGAPLGSRSIRFDVVYGPFGINTTNPATPLVQTLTVVTDSTGTAVAPITAQVNATTQPAQIRATDVTTGQPAVANFTIVNNTIPGGSPISVVPDTVTITSATSATCSTGFRIDYYIYGGNPPYTVSSTFPASVILTNTPVQNSGGFFTATTNGSCVDPLVFTIVDSAGKQAVPAPTLINKPGTAAPPTPSPLAIAPATATDIGCGGKSYSFLLSGGTPPYNITQVTNPALAGIIISPMVVNASGGIFTVTYPAVAVPPGTVTNLLVLDSSVPALTLSSKVTCN